MSNKTAAMRLDAEGKPIEAIAAYEALITRGEADLEVFLSLAVLYWQCHDFGFYSYHAIPEHLGEASLSKALETLDTAEREFGEYNELSFWRYYIRYTDLGGQADPDYVRELVRQGPSEVPAVALYGLTDGAEGRDQVLALVRQFHPPSTARGRYIYSVLTSGSGPGGREGAQRLLADAESKE